MSALVVPPSAWDMAQSSPLAVHKRLVAANRQQLPESAQDILTAVLPQPSRGASSLQGTDGRICVMRATSSGCGGPAGNGLRITPARVPALQNRWRLSMGRSLGRSLGRFCQIPHTPITPLGFARGQASVLAVQEEKGDLAFHNTSVAASGRRRLVEPRLPRRLVRLRCYCVDTRHECLCWW